MSNLFYAFINFLKALEHISPYLLIISKDNTALHSISIKSLQSSCKQLTHVKHFFFLSSLYSLILSPPFMTITYTMVGHFETQKLATRIFRSFPFFSFGYHTDVHTQHTHIYWHYTHNFVCISFLCYCDFIFNKLWTYFKFFKIMVYTHIHTYTNTNTHIVIVMSNILLFISVYVS